MAGREGSTLGAYRLIRRVGAGGMGEVYVAEGPATANGQVSGQVALKVLTGDARDTAVRETVRQAQVVASLNQPHIIPLYGAAQSETELGIVMALAPGGSLGDVLRREGANRLTLPLGAGVVTRIVAQLAHALYAAHAAGIVHGDLKPSNIFVRTSPQGQPLAVVGDFGQAGAIGRLVRLLAGTPEGATSVARASAQAHFIAPEQLRGPAQPASDQYSLAAIAYYLLTGQPPFVGEGAALLSAIEGAQVVPPSQRNPALSEQLDRVVLTGLARRPQERFPTIEAFAAALEEATATGPGAGVTQQMANLAAPRYGSGGAVLALNGEAPVAHAPSATALDLPAQDAPPRVRRRLVVVAAVAVAVVLLSCVVSVLALVGAQGGGTVPASPARFNSAPIAVTTSAPHSSPDQAQAAQGALAELTAATQQTPVFDDPLTTDAHQWPTDGKTTFFAGQRFHIANQTPTSVVTAETPGLRSSPTLAAHVTMTFTSGYVGDLAGLEFLVQNNRDGTRAFYTFLISPDGRYEVWLYRTQTAWTFVSGSYTPAVKTGLNQTNTLALLAEGQKGRVLLFANGQYIATVKLLPDGPASGTMGMVVIDHNAEAAYSQYAVYRP